MDLAYWGFSRWPFQRQRVSDDLNVGASCQEAYARLLFLVDERRCCGLLTGAAGTGKTRLLRRVKSYARRHGRLCLEIDATSIDAEDLAWEIAQQTAPHVPADASVSRCWSLIQQRFASLALVRQPAVIFVDHLDQADGGCEQALRRLMNLAGSQGTDLTLLLAARDPLVTGILREEIELFVELGGWSRAETAQFVTDSLRASGVPAEIFASEAIDAVHDVTEGIPREVIRICDLALLAAMSDDRHQIDATLVTHAAAELVPFSRPASGRLRSSQHV